MSDNISVLQDQLAAAERVIEMQDIRITELEKHLVVAKDAMQEFVDRVEKDEIRSRKTYSKFKTILRLINAK